MLIYSPSRRGERRVRGRDETRAALPSSNADLFAPGLHESCDYRLQRMIVGLAGQPRPDGLFAREVRRATRWRPRRVELEFELGLGVGLHLVADVVLLMRATWSPSTALAERWPWPDENLPYVTSASATEEAREDRRRVAFGEGER